MKYSMRYWRDVAKEKYEKMNFTNDPVTLALGICEEAGEIGKAVNVLHNPLYKTVNKNMEDYDIEHEIEDILVYLGSLANSLMLDIDF